MRRTKRGGLPTVNVNNTLLMAQLVDSDAKQQAAACPKLPRSFTHIERCLRFWVNITLLSARYRFDSCRRHHAIIRHGSPPFSLPAAYL